jgi:hypothetical protein
VGASEDIRAFWSLFRLRANDLVGSKAADGGAYDELLGQLQEIDPGLYLELATDPSGCELIVTADGEEDLFPQARAVVAAAPQIEGWTIHALKPRLGLPEVTSWEDVTLRTDTMVFDPLERGGADLGLRIFVQGLDPKDADAAHNAVLRALDHALGEERFAASVQYTEVLPLPANATRDDYIALRDLEGFLEWRDRRRAGGT